MVSHRIRDMREDSDLKQEVLSKLLRVTQATYSRYESGELNIPVDALITLARFYHTSTDYLLGLTDVPEPYPPGRGTR